MCGPLALAAASMVPAMASSVVGFIGHNEAAAANSRAAGLSYANTANQEATKAGQIDQQQSQNTVQAMIDRVQAQGRISASASSFGGDAASTTRAGNAADFAAGRGLGIEDTNSQNQRTQVGFGMDDAFYARQTQDNQVLKQSPLQLGLSLAGDVAGGASVFGKLGGTLGSLGGGDSGAGLGAAFSQLQSTNAGEASNITAALG
jgi:hypothetical protein